MMSAWSGLPKRQWRVMRERKEGGGGREGGREGVGSLTINIFFLSAVSFFLLGGPRPIMLMW